MNGPVIAGKWSSGTDPAANLEIVQKKGFGGRGPGPTHLNFQGRSGKVIGLATISPDPYVTTAGTLDNPQGSGDPQGVSVSSNTDSSLWVAMSTDDGLTWTLPTLLGTYGPIAAYPTAVGLGDDPRADASKFFLMLKRPTFSPKPAAQPSKTYIHRPERSVGR